MKLEVRKLVNGPVGESESFPIELTNLQVDDETIAPKVAGSAHITKLEDELLVKFQGQATVRVACDRCAGDFILEQPLRFSEEFSLDRSQPESEKLTVSAQFEIDLTETLRQEILAALPIKKLCQPDCAGLCPTCGADLNVKKCKCKTAG